MTLFARGGLRVLILSAACLVGPILGVPILGAGAAQAGEVTVFAASSLKTALDVIAADWQAATGNSVVISYDSSAKLARQIEQGAPADVFLSASVQWMEVLAEGGLIRAGSARPLLGNTLILVAADKAAAPVDLAPGFDLAALLGEGKLAMGLVAAVPAGQYGKEALEALGMWGAVAPQVVQADSARAALTLVETGEAAFGVVYGSDAVGVDGVTVVGRFPDDSHRPIIYPVAVVAASTAPQAQAFVDTLSGKAAAAVFVAQGFSILE